jgi:hypothetical protein
MPSAFKVSVVTGLVGLKPTGFTGNHCRQFRRIRSRAVPELCHGRGASWLGLISLIDISKPVRVRVLRSYPTRVGGDFG